MAITFLAVGVRPSVVTDTRTARRPTTTVIALAAGGVVIVGGLSWYLAGTASLLGSGPAAVAYVAILAAYHDHMASVRDQPGGPDAGRALFAALEDLGVDATAAGGSDWIVRPIDGAYPADEARVLDHLIETIHDAVGAVPDGPGVDLDRWTAARRDALDERRLGLVAHNLDVLARRSRS